jgi:hypothetical protein
MADVHGYQAGKVVVYRHKRAPHASVANLHEQAGMIALKGPAPSKKFLEEQGTDGRARD